MTWAASEGERRCWTGALLPDPRPGGRGPGPPDTRKVTHTSRTNGHTEADGNAALQAAGGLPADQLGNRTAVPPAQGERFTVDRRKGCR